MLTPDDIKAQIKTANANAIRSGGTDRQRERVTVRIDPRDNTAVFLYPDDPANLGAIAASFWECGGLQYGEVSYDWYYNKTKSPLTPTISATARETFARSFSATIAKIDANYADGHHADYDRFVPKFALKLPRR